MRVVAESCDQVLDATDPVAVRIEYRSVQERGEMEDFSHVMPLRVPQATPTRQLSPEKASVTCGRTVRERKTIQRNVGLKRASTSATKVTSSSPTPACVTKRARVDDGAAVDAKDREFFDQLSRLRVVEGHDVRATRRGVVLGLGKRRREESGQDSRASVIVGQSIDHLIERDQSGGREEPSLTHRSSESLSFNPGAFHQSSRTGEERADRRTETLTDTS